MCKYSENFFNIVTTSENIDLKSHGETLSIDLGSGIKTANPFNASKVKGVDIIAAKNIIQVDLLF